MMIAWKRRGAFLVRRRSPIRLVYASGRNMLRIGLPFGFQILLYMGR